MKELVSGDIKIKVRASNMALFYFEQEFKENLLSVAGKIIFGTADGMKSDDKETVDKEEAIRSLDSISVIGLLKVIWAMNKAENFYLKKDTKHFEEWLADCDEFNVFDCIMEAIGIISDGFFRTSEKKPESKAKKSK